MSVRAVAGSCDPPGATGRNRRERTRSGSCRVPNLIGQRPLSATSVARFSIRGAEGGVSSAIPRPLHASLLLRLSYRSEAWFFTVIWPARLAGSRRRHIVKRKGRPSVSAKGGLSPRSRDGCPRCENRVRRLIPVNRYKKPDHAASVNGFSASVRNQGRTRARRSRQRCGVMPVSERCRSHPEPEPLRHLNSSSASTR